MAPSDVEAYEGDAQAAGVVQVEIQTRTMAVPGGALFVPMAQPAAGIVAAALEPDSPGSYVGGGPHSHG